MLREVASNRQLLCITHLAQIACFADQHLVVRKEVLRGRTVSGIEPLGGPEERKRELARMLAGAEVSQAALDHAAQMLKDGQRARVVVPIGLAQAEPARQRKAR
jgi:DNA repair protein RecN (Recombination protein N)